MSGIFGQLSWSEPLTASAGGFTRGDAGAPWLGLSASGQALLRREGPLVLLLDVPAEGGASVEDVLASYQRSRELFLQELKGSFSLALWDEETRSLFLARDRVGRRPLWWSSQKGVSFSSSISQVDAPVDELAVRSYLRWGYIAAPLSGKSGWASLPAGSFLRVENEIVSEPKPYWDLRVPPRVPRCYDGTATIAQRARALLFQSTQTHAAVSLDTDFLGGALVASRPGAFEASYLSFRDARSLDKVKEFAAHHKTQCRALLYQGGEGDLPSLEKLFGAIYSGLEAPCADIFLPERFLSFEFATQSAPIVISSLGEDFLFGIEEEYQPTAKVERLPVAARRVFSRAASLLPERFFHGDQITALRQEVGFRRFSLAQKLQARRSLFDIDEGSDELLHLAACIQAPRGAKLNDRLFYTAFKRELPDECIAPFESLTRDRASLVLPFCNVELAELAATIPKKIETKSWLTKIFPEAPKPFQQKNHSQLAEWLRGPLRALFSDILGAPHALTSRFIEPAVVQRLLAEHDTKRQDQSRPLLALFSLELWLRRMKNLS